MIEKADKIFVNGNIISMDNKNHRIDFFAVKNNIIVKTGTKDELDNWLKKSNEVIDLNGKTVLPGFIDCHMHLLSYSMKKENQVDLSNVNSMDELINVLKKYISEKNIKPGEWVIGSGWNHENFPNKQLPTRNFLDKVSTENPIKLIRTCYHICAVNTKAFQIAGIDKYTQTPPYGELDKDKSGNLTGIIRENAINLIDKVIPVVCDKDKMKDLILKSCYDLVNVGITTVHADDFSYVKDKKTLFQAYTELENEKKLPIRIILQLRVFDMEDLQEYKKMGIKSWVDNDMLKFGPVKFITDGSLGSRTAALKSPYADDPDNNGILTFDKNVLENLIFESFKSGYDVVGHAIGDKAIEMLLKIYEKYKPLYTSKRLRPSIIHCQIVSQEIINKFRKNNIIANIQPIFLNYDWSIAEKRVGKERAQYSYCWKKFFDSGIKCAGSSDAPIDTFNPIEGIYCATARKDLNGQPQNGWHKEEGLSLFEALSLFTTNAAYLSHEENIKGSISEGKLADFIVLSDNIEEMNCDDYKDIKVLKTFVGGQVVD